MSDEFKEGIIDAEVDENGKVKPKEVVVDNRTTFQKVLDWCGKHPVGCICTVILAPLLLLWLGGKLFSTHDTEEIEVKPASIYDDYTAVPVEETITTTIRYEPNFPEE